MSILFTETAEKKAPRLSKKPPAKIFGSLAVTPKSPSVPSIFDDSADPFPDLPHPSRPGKLPEDPKPRADRRNGNQLLTKFIDDADPDFKSHVTLVTNTTADLTHVDRHKATVVSARDAQRALSNLQRLADTVSRQLAGRTAEFAKDFKLLAPHKSDPKARRGLLACYKDLFAELVSHINAILVRFSEFCLKMGSLIRMVQEHDDTDLLIRFSNTALEQTLTNFEAVDPDITRLESAIARVRRDLGTKVHYGDFSRCLDLAESTFDPVTNSYSDQSVDKLFAHVVERDLDAATQKRVSRVAQTPGAGGKVALAMAKDAMADRARTTDATLPVAFLMSSRYLFGQLYLRATPAPADGAFMRRVADLRKLAPAAFGVNPNFLDPRLLVSPLAGFPADHEYSPAIGFLTMALFEYCPIDFCHTVQKALMEIQQVASQRSFRAQSSATGMLCGKVEHLLSLDDLFDIALVVWLLAEPCAFQPLVAMFQPYIRGLELTSDLEFAFANITALVRHVVELDLGRLIAESKRKSQQEVEVEADPLNILGA